MALISLNNLERFFNNLKTYISNALSSKANTSHTHSASDITDLPSAITVDSALSSSSENPVQNKVVKNALDGKLDVTDVFATWNYSNGNLEIPNVYSSDIDNSLSSTSENPVQNKVITNALNGKANTSHTHSASDITSGLATVATSGSYNDLSNKPTIPTTLESLSSNSIPFHNAYPRCKYLGSSITDAQNTAIKNRTYDDLFIGDYWTINGVNWRIVVIDYYYNVGDTNFDKGNIIVMPDNVLYNAQMNTESTTAGAYAGSLMRTQNLNNARTIAQNAFGSHLANHRIMLAKSVDASGPNSWTWYDSDGVELPNEVQIYGTRVWGSALKGYDVGSQKQQFPLMALAPQFVSMRQPYWLQDVSSNSVSSNFALVHRGGSADYTIATAPYGVRPSVTLSYI